MPRARTAEDRILSHLARVPYPLETNDLVTALDVTRQSVLEVLLRMERTEVIVRLRAHAKGEGGGSGRPASLWCLPGAHLAAEEHWPRLRDFAPDTVVLTPSKRRARVTALTPDCLAVCEYLDDKDVTVVRITLLVVYQAGRACPEPVRVA
jgi:hypothetical protein